MTRCLYLSPLPSGTSTHGHDDGRTPSHAYGSNHATLASQEKSWRTDPPGPICKVGWWTSTWVGDNLSSIRGSHINDQGWGIYNRRNKRICICLGGVKVGNSFSCKEKQILRRLKLLKKKPMDMGIATNFKAQTLGLHIVDPYVNS